MSILAKRMSSPFVAKFFGGPEDFFEQWKDLNDQETTKDNMSSNVEVLNLVDTYQVNLDVPGVKPENIEIELEGRVLKVSGQRLPSEVTPNNIQRLGDKHVKFSRYFEVPEGTDASKIESRLEFGVLTLTIKKPENSKPQKIKIQLS